MLGSSKKLVSVLVALSFFTAHGAAVSNSTQSQTGPQKEPTALLPRPVLNLGHAVGAVGLKAAVAPAQPARQGPVALAKNNASPVAVAPIRSSIQSYKEWKTLKIQEVQNRVEWLKQRLNLKKMELSQKRSASKTEAQLSQELGIAAAESQLKSSAYTLEMTQDLTVSDYFAAYLTKQTHKKEAFKEVAGKMTPDEVAELMNVYANSMFSGSGDGAELVGDDAFDKVQ
jgi:hypothetical protein